MILVLTFVFHFFTTTARAEEPTFHSVSESEIKRLRKEVPQAFTGDLTLDEIDDLVRALAVTGSYERVTAEQRENGPIQIVARPLRVVKQVTIMGHKSFRDRELKGIVEIQTGDRFERKKVIEAGERLKQFYGERGFFNTVIEVSFAKETESGLSVIFLIDEREPCLIEDVQVQTENADLKDRIERLTQRLKRKPLTTHGLESLRSKVNSFLHKNRFLKADLLGPDATYNADKTRARLSFRLSEPFRYEFIVDGPKDLTPAEVYRSLSPDTIERGAVDPNIEAADRIRQTYLNRGYANVEVQSKVVEIPDSFSRRVKITVVENQRVKIKEIQVSGRVSRPSDYYEQFLRHNSSSLVKKGYYNRQDLEKGYENLLNELRNQGFLRAKIQSSRLEYTDQPGLARVILVMDEGPLTQLRTITFSGANSFPPEALEHAISLKANSPLRLADIEKALEELRLFYRNQGFLEVRILNENEDLIQYNDRGTQADVRFDVLEGPKVVVAAIQLDGNSFTESDVIYRTIDVKVGDVLTPAKIDESEVRLNRLGIFSRASVRTAEEGTNVSQRTLVVTVAERDPGTFRMGVGVNSERELTLRGFLGLSYNNLFGTARGLSGRVEVKSHVLDVNYPQYEAVGGYLEPFLFNSLTRGRLNLTRSERVFEFDSSTGATMITASNKVDLVLERDFGRHWRVNWKAYSLDARRDFERHGHCPNDSKGQTICRIQQVATIGPLIDIDYRDNPFAPSGGHFTTWNMDYSHPNLASSAGINFLRTEAGHTRYYPVTSPRYVFAMGVRGGYVVNLSNDEGSGVPVSQAFFLGGLSTIRGFAGSSDTERVPPGFELEVPSSTALVVGGFSRYVLIKSEFRFPLYGDHGGVVFYDGGRVDVSGKTFSRPYRDAVGVGYRYNTPVGPFSLDIGFKINPRRDSERKEDAFRVHFSWGYF